MKFKELRLTDSNFIKGLAILCIILHNIYRTIQPNTGENEFWFSDQNYQKFIIIIFTNPLEIFNAIFSFLGHYGVQAFIFLSAYGISKTYKEFSYFKFLYSRFIKIYPAFFLSVILYLSLYIYLNGHFVDKETIIDLLLQLSLLSNLIPEKALTINGPWWFFSFIFQFYAIYPIFNWLRKKYGVNSMFYIGLTGIIMNFFIYNPMTKTGLNPQYLVIGHLPEIALGIVFAHKKEVKLHLTYIFIALLILIVGNINKYVWPLSFISAALLFMIFAQKLLTFMTKIQFIYKFFTHIGSISLYLFAVHGIIRKNFISYANSIGSPINTIFIVFIFIILSYILSIGIKNLEASLKNYILVTNDRNTKFLRTLFVFILLISPFLILAYSSHIAGNETNTRQNQFIQTKKENFESIDDTSRISNKYSYSGNNSIILSGNNTFSPGIELELPQMDSKKLAIVNLSSYFYVVDSLASCHLVLEIIDVKKNISMEWNSMLVDNNELKTNQWNHISYQYKISKFYVNPKFKIKAYIWNTSNSTIYIDDFEIKLGQL